MAAVVAGNFLAWGTRPFCTVLYCCCRPFFQLVGDLTELNEKVYSDTEVQNPDQQLEEQVGEESTFAFSSNQV